MAYILKKSMVKLDKSRGFTLVELSIVIVIMGLLVAATLAGTSLLNTAKIKSVIGEIEGYKIAVNNFQIQYEGLPGDLKNATSFWTTAQNGGSVAVANGDGNEQIGLGGTGLSGSALESYTLWNHLTLSKYVPGIFLGNSTAAATTGTNIPVSKYITTIGFSINYFTAPFAYADALSRNFSGNYIVAGSTATSTNYPQANAIIPADAQYIDTKIDNGVPNSGKVLSGDGPSFVAGSCLTGSAYANTTLTTACITLVSIDNR